jgi:hypothetical protein
MNSAFQKVTSALYLSSSARPVINSLGKAMGGFVK